MFHVKHRGPEPLSDLDRLRDALRLLREAEIAFPQSAQEKLEAYARRLAGANRTTQLISRHDLPRLAERHLVESLAPLTAFPLQEVRRVLDLGSGGGLPGIPLAILLPGVHFCLLDSKRRRTGFLQMVRRELQLQNVEVVCERAESYRAEQPFDVVISRAVAALPQLWEFASLQLRKGGALLAMKGGDVQQEVAALRAAAPTVSVVRKYYWPELVDPGRRRFLLIVKEREGDDSVEGSV